MAEATVRIISREDVLLYLKGQWQQQEAWAKEAALAGDALRAAHHEQLRETYSILANLVRCSGGEAVKVTEVACDQGERRGR